MFETIANFLKKLKKSEKKEDNANSKDTAKERLHLVLMQDRANVSADFLELMKQEILEVIKKYIDVEEEAIDVRLTNNVKDDGTTGAPFLYANIPIVNIKNDMKKEPDKIEKKAETHEKQKENEKPVDEEKPEKVVEEKKKTTNSNNKKNKVKEEIKEVIEQEEKESEEQRIEEDNKEEK